MFSQHLKNDLANYVSFVRLAVQCVQQLQSVSCRIKKQILFLRKGISHWWASSWEAKAI